MSIYESQSVRLGTIGRDSRKTMAMRAMSHARHFGAVMICRDEYGSVWSVWRDGADSRRVLAAMPESVKGTYQPSTYHFAKTCKRFVCDVEDALQ